MLKDLGWPASGHSRSRAKYNGARKRLRFRRWEQSSPVIFCSLASRTLPEKSGQATFYGSIHQDSGIGQVREVQSVGTESQDQLHHSSFRSCPCAGTVVQHDPESRSAKAYCHVDRAGGVFLSLVLLSVTFCFWAMYPDMQSTLDHLAIIPCPPYFPSRLASISGGVWTRRGQEGDKQLWTTGESSGAGLRFMLCGQAIGHCMSMSHPGRCRQVCTP